MRLHRLLQQLRAKQVLTCLVHGIYWKRSGANLDATWNLVSRELGTAVLHYSFRVQFSSVSRNDYRGDALAPTLIGQPNDSTLIHAGKIENDPLDLGAVNILATGLDHVLDAVDQKEVALFVHVTRIAGMEPPIA